MNTRASILNNPAAHEDEEIKPSLPVSELVRFFQSPPTLKESTVKPIELKTIGKLMLPQTFLNNEYCNPKSENKVQLNAKSIKLKQRSKSLALSSSVNRAEHHENNVIANKCFNNSKTSLCNSHSYYSEDSSFYSGKENIDTSSKLKKIGKLVLPQTFLNNKNCNPQTENKDQLSAKSIKLKQSYQTLALSSLENSAEHHGHIGIYNKFLSNSTTSLCNDHSYDSEDSNADSDKENIDTSSKLKKIGKLTLPQTFLNNENCNPKNENKDQLNAKSIKLKQRSQALALSSFENSAEHHGHNGIANKFFSNSTTSLCNSYHPEDSSAYWGKENIDTSPKLKTSGKPTLPQTLLNNKNCNTKTENKVQMNTKSIKLKQRSKSLAMSSLENSAEYHGHNRIANKFFSNSTTSLCNDHSYDPEDSNADSDKENIDTSTSSKLKKIGKPTLPQTLLNNKNCNPKIENKVQLKAKSIKLKQRSQTLALTSLENITEYHEHNGIANKIFSSSTTSLCNFRSHHPEDSNADSDKEKIDTSSLAVLEGNQQTTPVLKIRKEFTANTNSQSLNTSGSHHQHYRSSLPQVDSKHSKYFGITTTSTTVTESDIKTNSVLEVGKKWARKTLSTSNTQSQKAIDCSQQRITTQLSPSILKYFGIGTTRPSSVTTFSDKNSNVISSTLPNQSPPKLKGESKAQEECMPDTQSKNAIDCSHACRSSMPQLSPSRLKYFGIVKGESKAQEECMADILLPPAAGTLSLRKFKRDIKLVKTIEEIPITEEELQRAPEEFQKLVQQISMTIAEFVDLEKTFSSLNR